MQPEELRRILKGNLLARRRELDLTQTEVARRAGISQAYWAQMEAGDRTPQFDLLAKLADALQTSPDALVSPEVFSPPVIADQKEFQKNANSAVDVV